MLMNIAPIKWLALAVAFGLVAPASAESQNNSEHLKASTVIDGACERVVINGQDRTGECDDYIQELIDETDRASWVLLFVDIEKFAIVGTVKFTNGLVAFTGKEIGSSDAGVQRENVDRVMFTSQPWGRWVDGTQVSVAVSGWCSYSARGNEQANISCDAKDKDGNEFVLKFIADGAPHVVDFPKLDLETQCEWARQHSSKHYSECPNSPEQR